MSQAVSQSDVAVGALLLSDKSGKGAALPDPTVPLAAAELPLTVQLLNGDTPACWQSTFAAGDVVRNQPARIKGKTP